MYLQSLKLLRQKLKEEKHLQENSIFDLSQNVAQYPLHHVTYPATKFEAARSNRLGGDTFTRKYIILIFDLDRGVKVTQNVAQYPLHYVTFSATKFEVATSKGLGGDAFTRNI